jgi:hypothetical protein
VYTLRLSRYFRTEIARCSSRRQAISKIVAEIQRETDDLQGPAADR